ncbi:MAG TPA: hypothetical protein ENI39_07275 [Anaerolineae bacterium]|nr:hypothetical protein [Anaerolineae bacterium]
MSDQQPPEQDWPDRERHDEKEEKEYEKQEKEHEKEEKSWDEKWRHDPVSAIGWAFVLIWAGLVLLLENLDLLTRFRPLGAWSLILIGAAAIMLLQVLIRLLVPSYRRPVMGTLIFAIILLAWGLGDLVQAAILWPMVLILIGVGMLLRGLTRSR